MTSDRAEPRVTVLMPVYNTARHVGDAMRTILAQTYSSFELLVVDDGSTDDSPRIIASFDDSRVRVVRNDRNLGLTPSLNRGLALARGEIIARQDADDLSEPMRLERQLAFLDAHPDVAVVGSWYRKIDETGQPLGDRRLPLRDTELEWALLFYCPIVHSAAMFRRDDILAMGGYDERFVYAQDFDLWSRVARRHRLANLPEFLVRYRVVATSLTASIGDRSGEGPRTSLENVRALMATIGEEAPSPSDHAAVCALLLGEPLSLGSSAAAESFARACRLLDTFCSQPGVAADATTLRAGVMGFLRRRFVRSADYFTAADFDRVAAVLYDGARWVRFLRGRRIRSALAAASRSRVGLFLARSATSR